MRLNILGRRPTRRKDGVAVAAHLSLARAIDELACRHAQLAAAAPGLALRSIVFPFFTYLTDAMSFSNESQEVPMVLFRVK